jgi:hypothetical protein
MPEIIKEGYLSLKEEGLRAWIWSKRYCVLRDQSLTFHRNEVKKKKKGTKQSSLFEKTYIHYFRPGNVLVFCFSKILDQLLE